MTAAFLDEMQQYLSVDQGDIWIRRMRFLYCPEESLIEQDMEPFFDLFLPNRLSSIDQLIDSLVGGGVVPGAMRVHVAEIRADSDDLRRKIQRLSTPILVAG